MKKLLKNILIASFFNCIFALSPSNAFTSTVVFKTVDIALQI